jgi:hypothetical protein
VLPFIGLSFDLVIAGLFSVEELEAGIDSLAQEIAGESRHRPTFHLCELGQPLAKGGLDTQW